MRSPPDAPSTTFDNNSGKSAKGATRQPSEGTFPYLRSSGDIVSNFEEV